MSSADLPVAKKSWDRLNERIINCQKCPRLVEYCQEVARIRRKSFRQWEYWGRPVPNLGDPAGRILLVGLAPAAHGANRTGRMFTGDRSGDFLFQAMHAVGLCNQPESSHAADGLELRDCGITAICHCAPPGNQPTADEQGNCQDWLKQTMAGGQYSVFVALGQLAWNGLLRIFRGDDLIPRGAVKFGHGVELRLASGAVLLGCYHPSQQNTFTGRLTQAMLRRVLRKAIRRADALDQQ